MKKKRFVWLGVVLLLAGAAGWYLRPRPLEVELGNPVRQTVQEYIAEEAKTRLADEYFIDMPIAGTLQRIEWEVGDEVQKGEVLARVDRFDTEREITAIEAQIAQARAQIAGVDATKTKPETVASAGVRVEEARNALAIAEKEQSILGIDLANAKRELDRARELVQEGVASQATLDTAERNYRSLEEQFARARLTVGSAGKSLEVAELESRRTAGSVDDNEYLRRVYQAQIDQLEAHLEALRQDLEKTTIRAPVSGPIIEKYIEDSRVLAPGTLLLKMGDVNTTEIECDVLSEEVVRVQVGARAEIHGKAIPGTYLPGTVERIYPGAFTKISSLGIEQQRVKVIIGFDNTEAQLRPGTRVDVRIITAAAEDAVAAPERSTFRREGQWYVFVVERGVAQMRPIKIGLKNDTWAEISDGLSLDDTIILEPMNELEPGARVTAKK